MKTKKEMKLDLKNLTDQQKNDLVAQYDCLINRITNQFYKKGLMPWDQLRSMALEGFALAINKYDPTRSNMSFTQYAGFAIRNNIFNCVDEELRTVKLSHYAQKKTVEKGGNLFNTVSLDSGNSASDEDTHKHVNSYKMNAYTPAKFADGDVFEYLYSVLEENFSERDCKMFYMSFGLRGYDDTTGKAIAKEMGVSEGNVSQRIKKVITFIRKDDSICEMLQNLA